MLDGGKQTYLRISHTRSKNRRSGLCMTRSKAAKRVQHLVQSVHSLCVVHLAYIALFHSIQLAVASPFDEEDSAIRACAKQSLYLRTRVPFDLKARPVECRGSCRNGLRPQLQVHSRGSAVTSSQRSHLKAALAELFCRLVQLLPGLVALGRLSHTFTASLLLRLNRGERNPCRTPCRVPTQVLLLLATGSKTQNCRSRFQYLSKGKRPLLSQGQ